VVAISVRKQAVSTFTVLVTYVAGEGDGHVVVLNVLVQVVDGRSDVTFGAVPHPISF